MRQCVAFCGAALTLGLVASQARAQDAAALGSSFGKAGSVAVGAERMFGYVHTTLDVKSQQPPSDQETTTTVNRFSLLGRPSYSTEFQSPYSTPRLGIDFFPIDGLSVGGS